MSDQREIEKIREQIIQGYKPEKIILFGSSVNKKQRSASDIDLAVIKKTKANFVERLKKIAQIVKSWEALDILVYTPKEWQEALKEGNYFIREITRTGKVIYEK